jgi:hypothetical protein
MCANERKAHDSIKYARVCPSIECLFYHNITSPYAKGNVPPMRSGELQECSDYGTLIHGKGLTSV